MAPLSRSSTLSSDDDEVVLALPPYLRDLEPSQRKALYDLRNLCAKNDVYWNRSSHLSMAIAIGGGGGRRKGAGTGGSRSSSKSNDDVSLLRYLRARGWRVPAAFDQYSSTVAWRRSIRLDELYRSADVAHFEAVLRLMPQWTGRRSRTGVPLFVYSVARVRPEDLLCTTASDPGLSSVFLPAEYSARLVQPLCARLQRDRAMPCLTHIIDLRGVGVRHFWSLRAHLQKAATMATSHYPEAVDRIFVVGAPSFFPTIWGYITKWFEPAITSKIQVLSAANALDVLSAHIHPDDIPRSFGGRLDWEYGMHPVVDDEIRDLVGSEMADHWPLGPLEYDAGAPAAAAVAAVDELDMPGPKIVALGSESEKKRPRRELVARLPIEAFLSTDDDGLLPESP